MHHGTYNVKGYSCLKIYVLITDTSVPETFTITRYVHVEQRDSNLKDEKKINKQRVVNCINAFTIGSFIIPRQKISLYLVHVQTRRFHQVKYGV